MMWDDPNGAPAKPGQSQSEDEMNKTELTVEERHYLGAILHRLHALYELTEAPNIREQLSDEITWTENMLGVAE